MNASLQTSAKTARAGLRGKDHHPSFVKEGKPHRGERDGVESPLASSESLAILQMQKFLGNQAVLRRLDSGLETPSERNTPWRVVGTDGRRTALQTKLEVNTPGDSYEKQADDVAEQVMRMPEPGAVARPPEISAVRGLQRKCSCGGTCSKCISAHQQDEKLQRKPAGGESVRPLEAPPIVHQALRSPGQPLDPATRSFMEPRLGDDFSRVRVHTDALAVTSSRSIRALAYTVGHDIVFSSGQYSPHTDHGKRLLAHELAHVVQQRTMPQTNRVARFSDDTHNIIEEAALTLAEMDPDEIKQIHLGNTKRDYSQAPGQANLLLLCDASTYGGYNASEHFDNFQWNEELQKFESRTPSPTIRIVSPIIHIEEQLTRFVDELPEKIAFQHVGNAFHAVEDFFAHSNFVELTHGDFRHGDKLITGSVEGGDDVSRLKILESISSLETAPLYGAGANQGIAEAPPKSHARMAKDYRSNPYQEEAMVLAGLVIKELGGYIRVLEKIAAKPDQIQYVRGVIMTTVKRYLRPPNEKDKWWETLRESGGQEMKGAIEQTRARTPVTQNQCILSPMRSIEASRDSNMKLYGPAFPIPTSHGHVWIQAGTGFIAPPAFNSASGDVAPRSMEFLPIGVQLTGRFDLFGGGK